MKLLYFVTLFLIVLALEIVTSRGVSASSSTADEEADYEDYEETPKKGRVGGRGSLMCPSLTLTNGRVRLRSRGRIAKFMCRIGFQGIGKRFATCIRGHWNAQPPICISRGCPTFIPPANGRMSMEYRGALLNFACNPGFALVGSQTLYCDGKEWNSTAPNCEVSVKDPPMSCDFEFEYLCGWSQDPSHDFDWKRFNFVTPSGHVGTGPSHDHTLGEGRDGFYMYIEASSPRVENDTARLFSPVYGAALGRDACFRFWYHMYGATTGQIRVYVKPVSKDISSMRPKFSVSGDQGNKWIMGLVHISPLNEPFQVVVEGVRGPSYVSDSAIDDVQLMTGSECANGDTSPTMDGFDIGATLGVTFASVSSEASSTDVPTDAITQESMMTSLLVSSGTASTTNAAGNPSSSEVATSTSVTSRMNESVSAGPTEYTSSSGVPSTVTSASPFPYPSGPLVVTNATTSTTEWTSTTVKPSLGTAGTLSSITFVTSNGTSTTTIPKIATTIALLKTTVWSRKNVTRMSSTASSSSSTARPTITSKPLSEFPITESVKPSTTIASTAMVHETTANVSPKVTNAISEHHLWTNTATASTSTMTTTIEHDRRSSSSSQSVTEPAVTTTSDDDVMAMTTSTDKSNVINIFPEEDDVVEVPKRNKNRPPPPWTYLKRRPSRTTTTTTDSTAVFVVASAARTANDRVSIPTVAGLVTVGVLSMAIVLIVARQFYRRNTYGRDTMGEDSDVRYLKDGEVRVEFSDLHMRYISGRDIISDPL